MNFQPYPFEKLNKLFLDVRVDKSFTPLSLTIGEPQFQTPIFIQDELKKSAHFLNKYPKISGTCELRNSQIGFVKRRFGIDLKESEIITTAGTREALFSLPQSLLFDKKDPVVAYPNPFYQIYEGAAIASRAQSILIPLLSENNFKPMINEDILKNCDLVMLNSPSNPTGSVMSLDELTHWVELALKYDFVLINDECYSEIYFKSPPPSLLQASVRAKNYDFKNILALNSISKRSSAPSLRSGFVAGDSTLLTKYAQYRTYLGCVAPLPVQMAARVAWDEDTHVDIFRKKYIKNFELAQEILGVAPSEATFYLWLEVDNDEKFAKELYKKKNVKTLPGSYLGRENIGETRVRIALVLDEEDTKEALLRIADFMEGR